MKRHTLLALLLVTLAQGDDEIQSKLSFADQTLITGTPLSTDGKNKLMKLTSPSLEGEVTIKTNQLLEIDLNTKPQEVESDHYALATIKSRYDESPPLDRIRGRLLHLDDESITLNTSYAGKLTLKRSMVTALDIYSQSPSFFNGPNGPEGWVPSSGNLEAYWTFENRSMTSKGTVGIAREVSFPERAVIKFSVKWKSAPSFRVLFLSNQGDSENPSSSFQLNLRSSYLSLYHSSGNMRGNSLFSDSVNDLRSVQSSEFTIYLDKNKEGTSAVYVGKEQVGTWTGIDATAGMGDWLHFVPQQSGLLNFSNISVSQWDGVLPGAGKNDPKAIDDQFGDTLSGQRISLANGDSVVGEIKVIEDDFVQAATAFGDVRIPLNRMRSIDLSDIKYDEEGKPLGSIKEQPRMWEQDIRAWFHDGGSITIRLDSIENGRIKGSSQVFGEADFDINAFSRLEFNIWERKLDPARMGMNEDW